jgi:hypothetical protein
MFILCPFFLCVCVSVSLSLLMHLRKCSYFRAVVGELDENLDSRLDLSSIRADPLNQVVH